MSVSTDENQEADVRVKRATLSLRGIDGELELSSGQPLSFCSPLVGAHNLANLCTTAAVAEVLGVGPKQISEGLATSRGAPGRLEPVRDSSSTRHVFVDYAHTDDAIRQALGALRALSPPDARLIVVFGCGGDRDRGKRPLMAEAASAADVVIVTSDNPRTEDPLEIIHEILPGLAPGIGHLVEPDRGRAIEAAAGIARPGDVVLIAGKGHETGQILEDEVRPFDDRTVAATALDTVAAGTREPPTG